MSRNVRRHYRSGDTVRAVQVAEFAGGVRAWLDGEEVPFRARRVRLIEGGAELAVASRHGVDRAVVVRDGDDMFVHLHGRTHRLRVVTQRVEGAPADDAGDPFAASPMTGVIMKMLVEPGAMVAAGGPLFVVEAMKMEFVVEAPRDVVVAEVRAAAGDSVDIGQVVVTFRGEDAA